MSGEPGGVSGEPGGVSGEPDGVPGELGVPVPGDRELIADAEAAAQRMTGMVAGVTFVALHAVTGVLTLGLAAVAPWWAVLAAASLWVAVARSGWRRRARSPVTAMLLPFGYAALLLAMLAAGSRWLGWSA